MKSQNVPLALTPTPPHVSPTTTDGPMDLDPLFERLQRALAPDYRLEREIGSGGMGIVYLAHDITLDCPVAVKILRPELATAHAAEAFLREAHILARVRDRNIVTIHHAGTREGLHYYIMELVGGPTLEKRLQSGPLKRDDPVKLGRDLLDGLESVHRAGIVHRDVKPSNVFVLPQGALLADFGIARPPSAPPRTTPNRRVVTTVEGTPGYMAPEQLSGGPITPQTDLYSAAAVIYEALTGRRYPPFGEPVSWTGISWPVARVLRRALRESPGERWPDARSFRRALWRTRVIRYPVRTFVLTVAGLSLGAAIGYFWPPGIPPAGAFSVALPAFEYVGPPARRWIADSLVQLVRAELRGHPDFRVTASHRRFLRSGGALLIKGRVVVSESEVLVELADLPPTGPGSAMRGARASLASWTSLRDSLQYRILLAVWDAKSPLAPSLPAGALPRTTIGLAHFLEAERLVAAARWGDAYRAYLLAEATDSTCWICSWRIHEVERWLSRPRDPARVRRYLAHVDSFPPWYASLIRAAQLPLVDRLDTLHAVTERWEDFFLGWFQSGDELFHRGALAGRRRAEAIPAFETAARLRPDFAPAWEHLAWVSIAEGDPAGARRALDSLAHHDVARDAYSAALRSLLHIAFAWRFLPEDDALALTHRALADPVAGTTADLGAGPRMLAAFDAPLGTVRFGAILAASPARDLQRSGLIAQALGSVALGRPLQAREFARQLTRISPDPDVGLFAVELDAAIALLDGPHEDLAAPALTRLRGWSTSPSLPERLRRRAAWMARRLAGGADTLDGDPFNRTIVHLAGAQSRARLGDSDGARRELLWHEHTDVVGLPTGLPQTAEIDWAFGALANWRLARLLDGSGDHAEVCGAYQSVVRHWTGGEPPYLARADTARHRVRELDCDGGSR
jgi:serine/threonine protein kinase/tetratricopeptide (TPR) repeat protein